MEIEVTRAVLEGLALQANTAHPHECCGILLGQDSAITALAPARNIHPTPKTHFEIDPQALVDAHRAARAGGPQVLGYYHSHPSGLPEPSATDRAMAGGDGRIWAIVAPDAIGWWLDAPDGFRMLPYPTACD